MKIAIIGATGLIGTKILAESLDRGHDVKAIVRHPEKLPSHAKLHPVQGDVSRSDDLASKIAGSDLVISAFNPGKDEAGTGPRSIIDAVKTAKVARLLVVGGAGSLEVAPGKRVIDQPDFPSEWKEGALRTAAFLDLLKGEAELKWTFLSPPAVIFPGERTGSYRVGADQLLTDGNGESRISLEDYAVAMLDEVETPKHPRKRFTVAY